jgi:hydrogenase maturation protease
MSRVLVAGIGNIFLGDDAFGVEVVSRLRTRPRREGVDIVDFGIRGIDLAYALESGDYASVILVDACPRGHAPGTLFVLEPENAPGRGAAGLLADAHDLSPAKVLAWAGSTGARPARVRIVGCEPSHGADLDEMCSGLSEPVAGAVDSAVALVERLLEEEASCTSSP